MSGAASAITEIRKGQSFMRRSKRLTWFGLLVAAGAAFAADADRRPNVVFILTDNQSAWTLGCYGN